jgi:hypothetical protein
MCLRAYQDQKICVLLAAFRMTEFVVCSSVFLYSAEFDGAMQQA